MGFKISQRLANYVIMQAIQDQVKTEKYKKWGIADNKTIMMEEADKTKLPLRSQCLTDESV